MLGLFLLSACGAPDPEDLAQEGLLEEEELGEARQAIVVDPAAGWYRIHSYGGDCVDVPSYSQAEDIIRHSCHYGFNQRVRFEPAGDDWYRLKFKHTGQYLTVPQNSNAEMRRLWQYPLTPYDDQLFRLEDLGDGTFRIWTKNNLALTYVEMVDADYWFYQDTDFYLTQYSGQRYGSFNVELGIYKQSLFRVDLIELTPPWPNVSTALADWGYNDRRWMVDFNGDGKADYCRAAGASEGGGSYLRCTFSTGSGFSNNNADLWTPVWDWGYSNRRWMVDVNGDDKTDYCRAAGASSGAGSYLRCTLSNGAGLNAPELDAWSPITDWGYSDRRWMIDFNGDGKTDYCRAAGTFGGPGSYLRCSFSSGAGLNAPDADVWIPIADWGHSGRKWMADVNGDGKADFCRSTGESEGGGSSLRCSLSNGTGFDGTDLVVPMPDWGGYADQRFMADVDGDGGADFAHTNSVDSSLLIFELL